MTDRVFSLFSCFFPISQEMFDLLVDLGARLHIVNNQGLTPLTLACYQARKEVTNSLICKRIKQNDINIQEEIGSWESNALFLYVNLHQLYLLASRVR